MGALDKLKAQILFIILLLSYLLKVSDNIKKQPRHQRPFLPQLIISSKLVSGAPTGLPSYELRGVQQEGRRRVNKQGDTCGWGWGGDSHLRPAQTFIRI